MFSSNLKLLENIHGPKVGWGETFKKKQSLAAFFNKVGGGDNSLSFIKSREPTQRDRDPLRIQNSRRPPLKKIFCQTFAATQR